MNLYISKDEMYPVYCLLEVDWKDSRVDVTPEFYEEYKRVEDAYEDMQIKLQNLYEERKK